MERERTGTKYMAANCEEAKAHQVLRKKKKKIVFSYLKRPSKIKD
jgi:hypothetical protein